MQHRTVRVPDHLSAIDAVARRRHDFFDAGMQHVGKAVHQAVAIAVEYDKLRLFALADIIDEHAQPHLHRSEQPGSVEQDDDAHLGQDLPLLLEELLPVNMPQRDIDQLGRLVRFF